MGYAAAGYCFNTGAEATAALSSAQMAIVLNTTKTGLCPLTWNSAGYATQNTWIPPSGSVAGFCSSSPLLRVTFPSCSPVGELAPQLISDPVGDSTAFYALAFVFLATIWAGKKVYGLFNKETA